MIYVDRSAIPTPPVLKGNFRRAALERARRFHRETIRARRQYRFAFDSNVWKAVRPDVLRLFHNKCAYCESPLVADLGTIEHFRPNSGATGFGREFWPDHYWWLAYDWSNILIACNICNVSKGNKFPIVGKRAPILARGPVLKREQPLLLDPCDAPDTPEQHLVFLPSGEVRPKSERGEVTIGILNLNRKSLVEARRQVSDDICEQWGMLKVRSLLQRRYIIKALMPHQPYLAIRRATIRALKTKFVPGLQPVKPPFKEKASFTKNVENLAAHYIERIEIKNFRAIQSLTLDFLPPNDGKASWLMLIGENGKGKTSILQAVALALSERRALKSLRQDPREFLRNGSESGYVRVFLSSKTDPVKIEFSKSSRVITQTGAVLLALRAYGATRLLPQKGSPTSTQNAIANLFDAFVPLVDVGRYMSRLRKDHFEYAARTLKDALGLESRANKVHIDKKHGKSEVMLRMHGHDFSLRQLSEGYKSVIALTVDMIAELAHTFSGDFQTADGVVLLDEIGAQLHPRWKMRIVTSFRRCFPRIQFLATTQDPLCLRGLSNGEVVVMHKTKRGRIYKITDLPPLQGLRVEQILTSEYFGLNSTLDPEVEADFEELYKLRALRSLTASQQARVQELENKLNPITIPAITRRERLFIQAIDTFLAREREEPVAQKRAVLKASLAQSLANAMFGKIGADND